MHEYTVVGGVVTEIKVLQHHGNVRDDAIGATFMSPLASLTPDAGHVLSDSEKGSGPGSVQAWADMCLASCNTSYGI